MALTGNRCKHGSGLCSWIIHPPERVLSLRALLSQIAGSQLLRVRPLDTSTRFHRACWVVRRRFKEQKSRKGLAPLPAESATPLSTPVER